MQPSNSQTDRPTKVKPFIAGATGYTGQRLLPLLHEYAVVAWQRTGSKSPAPAVAKLVTAESDDPGSLVKAMKKCDTIVQLIGTTRHHFAEGNSYEKADIGTTRTLVEAAKSAGTIRRFVLLSSVGTGSPVGAYLKAKEQAEEIAKESGIPIIIVRPSAITGPDRGNNLPHYLLPRWLRKVPLLGPLLAPYLPIRVTELAELLKIAMLAHTQNRVEIWEGKKIWERL